MLPIGPELYFGKKRTFRDASRYFHTNMQHVDTLVGDASCTFVKVLHETLPEAASHMLVVLEVWCGMASLDLAHTEQYL